MKSKDIRWQQRFSNYLKALAQLELFVEKDDALNKLEEKGLIKDFEYTHELAWNTIKDFYENQGETDIQGSRDAIRLAFKRGLIKDGDNWMGMLKDRNRTSHTYNEEVAKEIAGNVLNIYYRLFIELKSTLEKMKRQ